MRYLENQQLRIYNTYNELKNSTKMNKIEDKYISKNILGY